MAKDAKLVFTFPASTSAGAGVLAVATTDGVATITLSGTDNTWRKGTSNALNVGGFTLYAAGADTKGTGATNVTGPMGSDLYLNGSIACSTNFANSPAVQIMVEAASDNSGSAGTDWTPVSAAYQLAAATTTANLAGRRFNVKVVETAKPWFRVTALVLHGTAGTGAITLSNCALTLGRDGTVVNG